MSLNKYIAKVIYNKEKGIYEHQTIQQHTNALLTQYEILKKEYGDKIKFINWELLKLACIYHDLGKMNSKFQNKLMKKLGFIEKLDDSTTDIEIPHGYLSVAFLPRKYLKEIFSKEEINILYQSIYYHHNREKFKNDTLIKETVIGELGDYFDSFEYDKLPVREKLYKTSLKYYNSRFSMLDIDFDFINEEEEQNKLTNVYRYALTKGLLNKIDYAASSRVSNVEYPQINLEALVLEFISSLAIESKPNDLQIFMKENKESNVLTIASTGMGETEAGLLWINNEKGFLCYH